MLSAKNLRMVPYWTEEKNLCKPWVFLENWFICRQIILYIGSQEEKTRISPPPFLWLTSSLVYNFYNIWARNSRLVSDSREEKTLFKFELFFLILCHKLQIVLHISIESQKNLRFSWVFAQFRRLYSQVANHYFVHLVYCIKKRELSAFCHFLNFLDEPKIFRDISF